MIPARLWVVLQVNVRLCLIEIFSNMTRSVISSLGIFLGTASLLINLTFVRGMEADLRENMSQMGGVSILTIRQLEADDREQAIAFTRSGGLRVQDVQQLAELIQGIEAVLPTADMRQYVRSGSKGSGARVVAVSPSHGEVYNYRISLGRDLQLQDSESRARVCLIGSQIVTRLFGDTAAALGQEIVLRGIPFRIVGIIETKDRFDRRSRELHIPYATYKTNFASTTGPDRQVVIKVSDIAQIDRIVKEIEEKLTQMHRGVKDFEVVVNRDKIREMETASMGMRILILAIAIISLTVGAVSIMNTMFGTIGDRIREIGVRKALGARRIDVFLQFLAEAVLLSLVGGIPGIALGAAFTLFPAGTFPFTPQLGTGDYVLTVLFVVGAGVVSGLFPAFKASDMEPVEALRF